MSSEPKKWEGGELMFAGGTDWALLGRRAKDERDQYPNLYVPHRLKALEGIRIAFIAAGASAVHCLAGDVQGRLYTWGRNEKGQLGHGDLIQRNVPTIVAGLADKNVTGGCGGRQHSVVFTVDGASWSWGCNTTGQCGVGAFKNKQVKTGGKVDDVLLSPTAVVGVSGVTAVSAGVDFTLWLCGGRVLAAGNPQYGQTGDGSDHLYNPKESFAIAYDPQLTPKVIAALNGKNILRIAAGQNHSLATDDEGSCYSWGNGGYGRLGHRVQQDEFKPRRIETFSGRMAVPKDAVIGAGNTSSFCTGPGDQMYAWGKLKTSGDNQMYPAPLQPLEGWKVRSLSCGPNTFAVAAETSVITWGGAINGELGYGPEGKKSSAQPDKCHALEGVHVERVAAGVGFTLFLADPDAEKVKAAPEFAPSVEAEAAPAVAEEGEAAAPKGKAKAKEAAPAVGAKRKAVAEPKAAPAKRKAPETKATKASEAKGKAKAAPKVKAKPKPKAKGKKKASSSEEEEDDDEDDEDDE